MAKFAHYWEGVLHARVPRKRDSSLVLVRNSLIDSFALSRLLVSYVFLSQGSFGRKDDERAVESFAGGSGHWPLPLLMLILPKFGTANGTPRCYF
jgi:hypothetical protein